MGMLNGKTATTTSGRAKGTPGMLRRNKPENVAEREQVLAEETAAHAAAHGMTVHKYLAWAAAEGQKVLAQARENERRARVEAAQREQQSRSRWS